MGRLNLEYPVDFIQLALQRAIDLVSFGLQAEDKLDVESLIIPGNCFSFFPNKQKQMNIDEARKAFKVWVLANGLRDCVDAIGPSLEWARRICFLWTREGDVSVRNDGSLRLSAEITGEEWNEKVVKEGGQFDFWPLRKKIEFLKSTYGLKIPELTETVLGINRARNCLTHRFGVVGPQDCLEATDKTMVVHWKKVGLVLHGEKGRHTIELPARVKAGEKIGAEYLDVSQEFALGERIEFSSQGFVEIALTFFLFGNQIQQSICDLQQSRKST